MPESPNWKTIYATAKASLDKDIQIIYDRQKIILLADSAEKCGWQTVEEYVTNKLADNEEDKRRCLFCLSAS